MSRCGQGHGIYQLARPRSIDQPFRWCPNKFRVPQSKVSGVDAEQVEYNIRPSPQSRHFNPCFFPPDYKLEEGRTISIVVIVKFLTPSIVLGM